MSIRKIPLVTGEYYHVFNKTNGRRYLFLDTTICKRFIQLIEYYCFSETVVRFSLFLRALKTSENDCGISFPSGERKLDILCYCLMPTHFHLLVRQNIDRGISSYLSVVLNAFTRYLQEKKLAHGPVFLPRFKAIRIGTDMQLKHVSRYIHLNPFVSGVVKSIDELEKYTWSSYKDYLSVTMNGSNSLINKSHILCLFNNQILRHQSFVNERAGYQKSLEKLKYLKLKSWR